MKFAKYLILWTLLVQLVACGDDSGNAPCTENETRCGSAVTVEICSAGDWVFDTDCSVNDETCELGACVPAVPPICGDGTCDAGEDCDSCAADCGPCVVCDTGSPESLMPCADPSRYSAHLSYITGERTPGSTHWQQVQDHCASTLQTLGFTVELHDYGTGVNVIGTLDGIARPDEKVVLSAHYDHLPGCAGADDNASGVAGILEIAEVLSPLSFDRTLEVVCFDEEEVGLIGSTMYARRANNNADQIALVVNLDMIAYADDSPNSQEVPPGIEAAFPDLYADLVANQFRGNFTILQNDLRSHNAVQAMAGYASLLGRLTVNTELADDQRFDPAFSTFLRSDHAPFWYMEYPALTVNDTAESRNPYYHCIGGADEISTLDLDFAMDNVRMSLATTAFALDDTAAVPPRPPTVTCAEICNGLPVATPTEIQCIEDLLLDAGFPQISQCDSVTTIAECNNCLGSLMLQAGDCSILSFRCL